MAERAPVPHAFLRDVHPKLPHGPAWRFRPALAGCHVVAGYRGTILSLRALAHLFPAASRAVQPAAGGNPHGPGPPPLVSGIPVLCLRSLAGGCAPVGGLSGPARTLPFIYRWC